jgi:hypothetical protein
MIGLHRLFSRTKVTYVNCFGNSPFILNTTLVLKLKF